MTSIVLVVRRATEDVAATIDAATQLLPPHAWERATEAQAAALGGPLPNADVVALFVTRTPTVAVRAAVAVDGTPLAFQLAGRLGDPRLAVRVFVPDDECRDLHVTVDTLAYVEAWRHAAGESAVLLHRLRQHPFVWQRVCLHYEASPSVPRICDRNDRCVIGLAACKNFLTDMRV
jgi:hypothetical protein